ncbi:NAD-binding protein [Pseudogracilibacillus auburnensis]|uniref:NAD-binding protein n=1 Tax=Pseudogracilibacillus auburnensis TaxID=1494959 RepID=UPI001A96BC64|nr:NAD-binding protein [Pseudogracilibacillus auburnensis]MBO1002224.1 NAD-binding protein [Pseudogracilibacillus auburnensis]
MVHRFLKNKKIIMQYYVASFIVALFVGWWIYNNEAVDTTILLILVVFQVFFPVVLLFTRRYAVHIFLFTLALITGVYSFYHYSIQDHSLLNALYFTLQLFLLTIEDVFNPVGSGVIRFPLIVEIARWSAALYTISTVFIAMYRMLEMSIILLFYQLVGKHYVIIGFNENSKMLMKDLKEKKKRVILIVDNISIEDEEYLENMKIVLVKGSKGDNRVYQKCAIEKAVYVILFQTKDTENLDELIALKEYCRTHFISNSNLTVLVHLINFESNRLIDRIEAEMSWKGEHFPFSIQSVNVYYLLVAKLFDHYPMYLHYESQVRDKEGKALHLLIVGFGHMGHSIALQAIKRAHFFTNKKIRITILDKCIERVKRSWYRNYPKSDQVAELEFLEFDINSQSLVQFVEDRYEPFTHIYLCLHDDYLDVMEGIELSKRYPHIPVFMNFNKHGIIEKWIQGEASDSHLLYSTGTFAEVLNEAYFIHEKLTITAKLEHNLYKNNLLKAGNEHVPTWENLSQIHRQSNYNKLDHARTKLMLLSLDVVPKKEHDKTVLSKQEYNAIVQPEIEQLAKTEHNRWYTFYLLMGWDMLECSDSTSIKDESRKLHSALVPYERLNEPELAYVKQYHRDVVYELFDVWNVLGYDIVKREDTGNMRREVKMYN